MKSLLSKILFALIGSTVLALVLVTLLSRAALQRGFVQFLEQQEENQLHNLVPELAGLYRRKGNWDELVNDPRLWMRLLMQTRPEGVRPPDEVPPEFMRRPHRPGARITEQEAVLRDARYLWRRIFLLDENRDWVAGGPVAATGTKKLVAIEVGGKTVGWVGFRAAEAVVAPEARRFLDYQGRALLLSLLIALILVSVLGYLLARNLSRPVTRLRDTVHELTSGRFSARAKVESSDEIGELARYVNRLAETLEKNETSRRRWTADIAHELRTPLAVLQGELDAVKDGMRPFTAATVVSLQEEVAHLSELVADLQTLALADAGALNIRLQNVDLASLLRQVMEGFAARLSAAGLRLDADLPPRLELPADPQRLRQLLQNLLENSCRYTHAGGKVQIRLTKEKQDAVLEIADSAPGVDGAHWPHLFDRFYRVEPSRGRAGGGSGLGLAICRNIIEAHGGEISAGGSPLGGLAIHIRLPLKP
jgi:two-component system sensor histidine kinase BaeS